MQTPQADVPVLAGQEKVATSSQRRNLVAMAGLMMLTAGAAVVGTSLHSNQTSNLRVPSMSAATTAADVDISKDALPDAGAEHDSEVKADAFFVANAAEVKQSDRYAVQDSHIHSTQR